MFKKLNLIFQKLELPQEKIDELNQKIEELFFLEILQAIKEVDIEKANTFIKDAEETNEEDFEKVYLKYLEDPALKSKIQQALDYACNNLVKNLLKDLSKEDIEKIRTLV